MEPNGILIVGSAGFVGSRLLQRLTGICSEIHAISSQPQGGPNNDQISYYLTSLDDPKVLKNVLPRCKTVLYLASHSTPGSSALKPSVEAQYNLLPGLRFLEVLHKFQGINLIYLSSGGAVYGSSVSELVTEERPLAPVSYYGAGKASMEKFILAYCRQSLGKATILRPTNFYGPGQPYKPGFGIIPTIFHKIINDNPLQIWGDGQNIRDYLYIEDFIDLCIELIGYDPIRSGEGKTYNVGAEKGISINQLCEVIETVTGKNIVKEYREARRIDVSRSMLGCEKINCDFNWKAKTDLHTGIQKTWEWYLEQN